MPPKKASFTDSRDARFSSSRYYVSKARATRYRVALHAFVRTTSVLTCRDTIIANLVLLSSPPAWSNTRRWLKFFSRVSILLSSLSNLLHYHLASKACHFAPPIFFASILELISSYHKVSGIFACRLAAFAIIFDQNLLILVPEDARCSFLTLRLLRWIFSILWYSTYDETRLVTNGQEL